MTWSKVLTSSLKSTISLWSTVSSSRRTSSSCFSFGSIVVGFKTFLIYIFYRNPVVPVQFFFNFQAMGAAFLGNGIQIFPVKATEKKASALFQAAGIDRDIPQKDIPVDIGQDGIVFSAFQKATVPLFDPYVRAMVPLDILQAVQIAPRVHIDGIHRGGTFFMGQDGQYPGATAHVEHRFSLQLGFQDMLQHHMCRLMVAGAETHFGLDDDI